MRVLGISPLDKDATVSLLEDGRVVFACGEERLSRVKLQDGFPHLSLKLGLERAGWAPGSIDAVAYAFFDGDGEARLINEALARDAEIHSRTCTWESLQRLKTASANGYQVDRSKPIPGFLVEAQEFMPRKAWWKRLGYKLVTRFARLDWRCHRRYFKQ